MFTKYQKTLTDSTLRNRNKLTITVSITAIGEVNTSYYGSTQCLKGGHINQAKKMSVEGLKEENLP